MSDEQEQGEAARKPRAKKVAETRVLLLAGYWPPDADIGGIAKMEKNTEVFLPVPEAKRLIAEGKAERADPFPGEE